MSKVICVVASPYPEDSHLPWQYSEDAFCDWVHEVFLEGNTRKTPLPSTPAAIALLISMGYKIEIKGR